MPPTALILRAAGTNCDTEMARAFTLAGARVSIIHLDALCADPSPLAAADLLGFPGGFSFGDDIASGRIFAAKLKSRLWPHLRAAAARSVPMIAVCNGFQILVQCGLLPGPIDGHWPETPGPQELSLAPNASARFHDTWSHIAPAENTVCIWTKNLLPAALALQIPSTDNSNSSSSSLGNAAADSTTNLSSTLSPISTFRPAAQISPEDLSRHLLMLPVAHGEGRLVAADPAVFTRLAAAGQLALRYAHGDNPSGSTDAVAGICDARGLILGLMPHPERYLHWNRHPYWSTLRTAHGLTSFDSIPTPGLQMFKNAVAYVQSNKPELVA
ncbi:phosphoribosylformylglycinamidine synthase I [soil metagenome]